MANIDNAVEKLQQSIKDLNEKTDGDLDEKDADSVVIVEEGATDPFSPAHSKAAEKAAQADEAVVMSKEEIAELEGRELTREEKFERLANDPDSNLGFDY